MEFPYLAPDTKHDISKAWQGPHPAAALPVVGAVSRSSSELYGAISSIF